MTQDPPVELTDLVDPCEMSDSIEKIDDQQIVELARSYLIARGPTHTWLLSMMVGCDDNRLRILVRESPEFATDHKTLKVRLVK